MMDPRPLGILLLVVGAIGTAIAALADPLGLSINADDTFGWLQITGTVVGAVVMLLGLVIATEWLPLPWGARRGETAATTASPQTTVVTGSSRRERTP